MRPSGAWLRRSNRFRWTCLRQNSTKTPIPYRSTTKWLRLPQRADVPELRERRSSSLKPQDVPQGNTELDWEKGVLHLTLNPPPNMPPKLLRRPNIRRCNVHMLEACRAGDTATAWRIYDLIRAARLKPDVYTYSILINDAKKRDDVDAMEQMLVEAWEEGLLSQSPFIVTNLLHAVYLSERRKEGGGAPFTAMLSTYQQHFELQPLKDLGLLPEYYEQPPSPSLMRPPPPPLGMMIIAFLVQHEGRFAFEVLFNRYRDHVNHRHPIISPLAMTDHTANAYLMALGRQLRTLPLCTSVVHYMLRLSKLPTEARDGSENIKHAAPSVQTWSILLAAFLRHGQRLAAHKVLSLMQSKNVKPNQVTWNTLISGHAALQDVDGALSALRSLKEDGFEMDDHTLRGLGRISDRRRLMEALQEADELEQIEERAASSPADDDGWEVAPDSDEKPQQVNFTPLPSQRGG